MALFWRLLPEPIRTVPADIAVTFALVVLANLTVLVPVLSGTTPQILAGLLFVLFVPGYTFVAAMFPAAGTSPSGDDVTAAEIFPFSRGIDTLERLVLSGGMSVTIASLVGLFLSTTVGFSPAPVVTVLSLVSLLGAVLAVYRRRQMPPAERFGTDLHRQFEDWHDSVIERPVSRETVLNVVLAVSVVAATLSVGYVLAVPNNGEQSTELYLLAGGPNSDFVSEETVNGLSNGSTEELTLAVGNDEREHRQYTVLVRFQEIHLGDNETTVLSDRTLDEFRATVGAGETWTRTHTVSQLPGEGQYRLVYLLYVGDPPADPTVENAYRSVKIVFTVQGESPASVR
ncbi:DUF1616 domain-containing protein [Halomicrobium sp. IBSBa]|uniref:DUF1616 domain-containing protein n=1 Tax=Halomicrobium sp. IBSBa TaxID=2778916 RepID=UPI001ABFC68C|nr:DUF1616 domain-containing protein [Halomicrobium sp. IBSBa]MBO4247098.1 DUF1616 domain-containing protein [Halomicrobium sp. IBSBa]